MLFSLILRPDLADSFGNTWEAARDILRTTRPTAGTELPDWLNGFFDCMNEAEQTTGIRTVWERAKVPLCYHLLVDPATAPHNIVPLGDAMSKLNPVYGQGSHRCLMDVAILHALLLQETRITRDAGGKPHFPQLLAQYVAKQKGRSRRLFQLGVATDMDADEVRQANPHLDPKLGTVERWLFRGCVRQAHKVRRLIRSSACISSVADTSFISCSPRRPVACFLRR